MSNDPHRRMRRALKASALACRRSTAALAAANERRSSAPATRFLGPGRGARSRWFERSCAAQRALPAPSCPSPAGCPAGRSWCRPGVYPRSRPGAAVTSRRPREPLSLRPPASPADVLYGGARFGVFVAETGTNVKKFHYSGDGGAGGKSIHLLKLRAFNIRQACWRSGSSGAMPSTTRSMRSDGCKSDFDR